MIECVYREDVRMLLSIIDPGGVRLRRQHRLNRRVYTSNVGIILVVLTVLLK
jgi:hypothetical protein